MATEFLSEYKARGAVELSVVTSLYKSAPYLRELHRRICAAAEQISPDFELILVNDASPDNSLDEALRLADEDPRVNVIDLSRNFGQHKAIMAGLQYSRGRLVFMLDSDLEEDPEYLNLFFAEMQRTGADVVYGSLKQRQGGLVRRYLGAVFWNLFGVLTDKSAPMNVTAARLMTRRYVDSLLLHTERTVFLEGLWAATGFEQRPVEVTKNFKGDSGYTLIGRLTLAVDAITSYSNKPLIYVFMLGCLVLLFSSVAGGYLVLKRLLGGDLVEGWVSLIVSIAWLGGLVIFCQGILGIYLARIFLEVKQRPNVIIKEIYRKGGTKDNEF